MLFADIVNKVIPAVYQHQYVKTLKRAGLWNNYVWACYQSLFGWKFSRLSRLEMGSPTVICATHEHTISPKKYFYSQLLSRGKHSWLQDSILSLWHLLDGMQIKLSKALKKAIYVSMSSALAGRVQRVPTVYVSTQVFKYGIYLYTCIHYTIACKWILRSRCATLHWKW